MAYFDAVSEVNGMSVIASAYVRHGVILIMAEGYRDGGLVYVVSEMGDQDDYWHSGTYFDRPNDSQDNRRGARCEFANRLAAAWKD